MGTVRSYSAFNISYVDVLSSCTELQLTCDWQTVNNTVECLHFTTVVRHRLTHYPYRALNR